MPLISSRKQAGHIVRCTDGASPIAPGWFSDPSPFFTGGLSEEDAAPVLNSLLNDLFEELSREVGQATGKATALSTMLGRQCNPDVCIRLMQGHLRLD